MYGQYCSIVCVCGNLATLLSFIVDSQLCIRYTVLVQNCGTTVFISCKAVRSVFNLTRKHLSFRYDLNVG